MESNVMKLIRVLCLALLAALAAPLQAADVIRQQPLAFDAVASRAVATGRIVGRDSIDFLLEGKAGQEVVATLEADSTMAYFNVLPPGSDEAIFIGSVEGGRFSAALAQDGTYRLRVYLIAAEARRDGSARFTLTVDRGAGNDSVTEAFAQTLSLHGITFRVDSPNHARGNTLRIVPSGLSADNAPIVQQIEGVVTGAEIADLDIDQAPEVYVYVRLPGKDARMQLVAYSSNRNRSLSQIFLPPLEDVPGAADGFTGNDAMAVIESVFAWRFPLAGGKYRQLQYRLAKGEASWILKFDRMTEF
jgi:hypothetical protein